MELFKQEEPHHRPIVEWTEKGLYCTVGDFYIDPHRAVDVAVVTHAHSDHARRGSRQYYCEASGVGLLKSRLGSAIKVEGVPYQERFKLGRATVSFHSAGHILGSAQVRIEYEGEVWVASGDYKRDADPSCTPFETVKCDTFITEATFGTPKYVWQGNRNHGKDIFEWWQKNAEEGLNSVLFGYSLGKAQRILAELFPYAKKEILVHPAIEELNVHYREAGIHLAPTKILPPDDAPTLKGELVLAPPSILKTKFLGRLGEFRTAFASGWMVGHKPSSYEWSYDFGFVMSDHADWPGLLRTIEDTGARRVFVQHRENGALVRALKRKGLEAFAASELLVGNFARLPETNLSLFPS